MPDNSPESRRPLNPGSDTNRAIALPRSRMTWIAMAGPVVLLLTIIASAGRRLPPDHVAVSGFLFLDEAPLCHADIFLVPADETARGKTFFTRSNNYGFYEIVDGAPQGTYHVVVRKAFPEPGSADQTDDDTISPDETLLDEGQRQVMLAARPPATTPARTQPKIGGGGNSESSVRKSVPLKQLPAAYTTAERTVLQLHVPATGNLDAHLFLHSAAQDTVALNNDGAAATR
ncbi:MAG: hypothetical protein RIK87_12615 [Fuerstiella sp.]